MDKVRVVQPTDNIVEQMEVQVVDKEVQDNDVHLPDTELSMVDFQEVEVEVQVHLHEVDSVVAEPFASSGEPDEASLQVLAKSKDNLIEI